MTNVWTKAQWALKTLDWRQLGARPGRCPICGPTLFVRLNRTDWGVRCLRCGSAPNTLLIAGVLQDLCPNMGELEVYALASHGPLFDYLLARSGHLTFSYYDPDVPPGESRDGVLCQDVQRLTFADDTFDLCVHSEVFEHVADDEQGFRDIHRVLKPGGLTVFTVPVFDRWITVERARLVDGEIEHLLPPSYHNDQLRGPVLAFRDYGRDITSRLTAAGFADVRMISSEGPAGLTYERPGFDRPVIVGRKP
jgi:SAM-dependent methyltransferase